MGPIETGPHLDLPYAAIRPRRICLCRGVTEEMIHNAVDRDGARTFEEVQKITRCSTGCGSCEGRVRDLLKQYLEEKTRI